VKFFFGRNYKHPPTVETMYAILIMAIVQIVLNIIMFMKISGPKAQAGIAKAASQVCEGDCANKKARAAQLMSKGQAALAAAPESAVNAAGQVFDTVKPFAAARQMHMATNDDKKECGATAKMHKIYRGSSAAAYPAVSFNGTKNMGVNMLKFMPHMNAKPRDPSTTDPWGGVNRPAIS